MPDEPYTPFAGKTIETSAPKRVLHRFTKPGRVAEIRERQVTQFRALEFLVFVDGHLQDSHMFHGARLPEYPTALEQRRAWLREDGWIEDASVEPATS